ncbi:MAG: hypothetical protein HKN47_25145 [Pirellulaceae bacterium]|nr:hypothetical protein [Pirellulaceae bacterium]
MSRFHRSAQSDALPTAVRFRAGGFLSIAGVLLIVTVFANTSFANPSSKDPSRGIAAHGTIPQAKEMVKDLYDLYNQQEQAAINLLERSDNPSRLPYKQMEKAGGELWKAARDARHLALMGEPASKDLEQKIGMVNFEMLKLMGKYLGSTPGARQSQKNRLQLTKTKPRNDKFLDQMSQEIKNGRLEQAEQQLEKLGIELYSLTFILPTKDKNLFLSKFIGVVGDLDSKFAPVRRQQYFEQAKQAASKNLQVANAFAAEARRVRTEMGSGGTVRLKDGSVVGAAGAIRHLAGQWGNASAALIRNTAIQWAFAASKPSSINTAAMKQVSQAETTAKNAIIAVIDAAATATPPEEVPQVYSDVLSALSYVDRRMIGSGISKDCEPALSRLASKQPGFPAQVAAYGRATEQPLIWRERFAREQVKTLTRAYPNASAAIVQKLDLKTTNKPKMYGRPALGKRVVVTPQFGPGAGWKVFEAASVLLGMRLSEEEMVRLKQGSLTALVRHTGIHYSNVAVGMPVQRELDDLKVSMLVDEEYLPLSMEAAGAISSAELQDFLQVGGAIRRLHLEAAVSRFITLPGIAHQLAPLGKLPAISDELPAIEQACWRLDVEPHWVRHRYFTVAIRSKLPKQ